MNLWILFGTSLAGAILGYVAKHKGEQVLQKFLEIGIAVGESVAEKTQNLAEAAKETKANLEATKPESGN